MKGYLLDTGVLVEIRRGERCDGRVAEWFEGLEEAAVFTSVLVIGEIRRGIERAREEDSQRANMLDFWLEGLLRYFAERVLPIDDRIANCWGRLCAMQKISDTDGLLAATAIVHDLTFATERAGEFRHDGLRVINPFEGD